MIFIHSESREPQGFPADHRSESRLSIPRRDALQRSSSPLPQPSSILKRTVEFVEKLSANGKCLILGLSHFRGAQHSVERSPPALSPFCDQAHDRTFDALAAPFGNGLGVLIEDDSEISKRLQEFVRLKADAAGRLFASEALDNHNTPGPEGCMHLLGAVSQAFLLQPGLHVRVENQIPFLFP